MKIKSVVVLPYDPRWEVDFETIRQELADILGELAIRIEHVGSTSVPGLSAKPIIDLDVVMEDYGVFPAVISRLEKAGYEHEGNLGIQGREAFRYDGKPHLRKHHLYVCPADSQELHRHLTFRNYLRSHPEAAKAYSEVKKDAARQFPNSIEEYMDYKAGIIRELYAKCGLT